MFSKISPFIESFVQELSASLKDISPSNSLTTTQEYWIKFCLMGILMTNSISWSEFNRVSLGKYKISALSWMLRHSKILWGKLLQASLLSVLRKFDLNEGVLVFDDTDKKRCKKTKRIHFAHKVFDKSTSGYFNGQSLVFLVLVTRKITIPVGFKFYIPEDLCDGEKIIFESKLDLGVNLLEAFSNKFPNFRVNAILADAFYGSKDFADEMERVYPKSQFISQLKSNQNVYRSGKKISVKAYFENIKPVNMEVQIRGKKKKIEVIAARLKVYSHGKKRFVIALRYEGEETYRYIYGTRLAWSFKDIIEVYGLRWLIEVFFQDWKGFEGLRELQLLDVEGSERALILSLLFDSSLFFHKDQSELIEEKLSACTVGSLLMKCRVQAFVGYFKDVLFSEDPMEEFKNIEDGIGRLYKLRLSEKHMVGCDLGPMEPSESLKCEARKETPLAA